MISKFFFYLLKGQGPNYIRTLRVYLTPLESFHNIGMHSGGGLSRLYTPIRKVSASFAKKSATVLASLKVCVSSPSLPSEAGCPAPGRNSGATQVHHALPFPQPLLSHFQSIATCTPPLLEFLFYMLCHFTLL